MTPHPELWLVLVMVAGVVFYWQDKPSLTKAKALGKDMFWCALLVLLWLLASRPLHFP